jgi:hypothetical protein
MTKKQIVGIFPEMAPGDRAKLRGARIWGALARYALGGRGISSCIVLRTKFFLGVLRPNTIECAHIQGSEYMYRTATHVGAVALAALLTGCPKPPETDAAKGSPGLPAVDGPGRAAKMLAGRFDASAQAARDTSYYSIQLAMCPITTELGAPALYVEQADMTTPKEPYRQRVLVLRAGASAEEVVSYVYEFKDPKGVIGLCDAPRAVLGSELEERSGCEVRLSWVGDHYEGKTGEKSCPSSLRGASYATSEVKLYADRMLSWDRGFDITGKQVWGATKGAYEFLRK